MTTMRIWRPVPNDQEDLVACAKNNDNDENNNNDNIQVKVIAVRTAHLQSEEPWPLELFASAFANLFLCFARQGSLTKTGH